MTSSATASSQQIEEAQECRTTKRGTRGRFVSSSPLNTKKIRRAENQRKHIEIRKNIQTEIYEAYLLAFVVQGTMKQSLPVSRSKGPLVSMYLGVVKDDFCLGANVRYAAFRRFFVDGGHLRTTTITVPELSKRARGYKGCRLPLLAYGSEMSEVRRWIKLVAEKNALIHPSVDEGYEYCKQIICSYGTGRGTSSGETVITQQVSSLNNTSDNSILASHGSAAAEPNSSCEIAGSTEGHDHVTRTATDSAIRSINAESQLENASETGYQQGYHFLNISEQETQNREKGLNLFAIARDDTMYMMVHFVLDTTMEHKFGLFSQQCLEELEEQGVTPTELFLEALKYAHWNRFGIPDEEEHTQRRKELEATAFVLDRIRTRISTQEKPFPLYKDITKWDFRPNRSTCSS